MKSKLFLMLSVLVLLCSCGGINKYMQSGNLDYRYEKAKQYFVRGKYDNACILLSDMVTAMKGTERGDEALFLFGMSKYRGGDLSACVPYFTKYYQSYPTGNHVEEARFYAGRALYLSAPNPNLDQSDTYMAITEFQNFVELYPQSRFAEEARRLIFELQDKLVEKQYLAAKLYYDLGGYFLNCTFGGSNYQAAIITAQNAIRDYPYTSLKENFSILILRARWQLALQSVEEKKADRYNETVDEYYGFVNEFPESKYKAEADAIFEKAKKATKQS